MVSLYGLESKLGEFFFGILIPPSDPCHVALHVRVLFFVVSVSHVFAMFAIVFLSKKNNWRIGE